ncbi:MAG: 50S ribosomal protein L25/general stress protein Ctc [Alphaproteobacteria bacterium]|nr:50S ribosomal protein L25/general stress protein Ctc [Alphaproteobacteria bacterium]
MSASGMMQAEARSDSGTGVARSLRRDGKVPGIVYGDNKEPQMISVDYKTLALECQTLAFFNRVINLSVNGNSEQVIPKFVQLHPVTDFPLHVDFQRLGANAKVHVFVPITFANEDKAPGLKLGGVLNIVVHSLEMICSPQAIPENLVIDLAGAEMGRGIHLSSITLPAGTKAAHADRDDVLATIVAPSGFGEEAAAK